MIRPALGQSAALGDLYDARTDSFLGISLLSSPAPDSAVSVVDNHTSDVRVSVSETYGEKLSKMNISAELGASFLSGMIDVRGSGSYLKEVHESDHIVQMSLHYSITTVDEKLNFSDNELKGCLQLGALESGATHVVAGIAWGARSIVTGKHQMSGNNNRSQIEGKFHAELSKLKSVIQIDGKADLEKEKEKEEQSEGMSFDVTVYGDVLANDGLLPTDLESACKFIRSVPGYVAAANSGKGKPITYTLLPLDNLTYVLGVEIKADVAIKQLSMECLERFVSFFDDLCKSKQKLHDHYLDVQKHQFCVPPAHRLEVAKVESEVKVFEANQKSSYARVLKEVRSGHAKSQELSELLKDSLNNEDMSPERIAGLTKKYCGKMKFADFLVSKGARYIGDDDTSLGMELMQHHDAYVFHFNEEVMHKQSSWEGNRRLLNELLSDTEGKNVIIIVDRDASGAKMEKSYIKQYRDGFVISEDLLEQNQLMADKCLARHSELDSSRVEKPLRRSPVRIRCPGRHCIQDAPLYHWICFKCHAPLEYADRYMYCDCGRALYSKYVFRCKEARHGAAFTPYDSNKLLELLNALEPFAEVNILILGETGVGKSTFINAFINYLTFKTLDEALDDEKLHWVIPCSFSVQTVDSKDPNGKFVESDIQIDHSDSEHDGATGQSATQKPSVYAVPVDDTIVRLIDTPGIGHTAGVEMDKKSMDNILWTLTNFSKLHGVLILLKPNSSRLHLMFRFCVQELLKHLHRDAVQNMVFGFTHTRMSNYKPGDTFKPLQSLLQDHANIGMELARHNVYCYDSESFRFLAARKSGVEMDGIDDFRRSWEHSRKEGRRMLDDLRALRPHDVQCMLSLNRTRDLITRLTKPMADIARTIETTIRVNEDNLMQLDVAQRKGDGLRELLYFQKVVLELNDLKMPRTVCSHKDCVEYSWVNRDDGKKETRTEYKSICHDECYVRDGAVKVLGWLAFVGCRIMGYRGYCKKCGHHYKYHVHVRYEQSEKTVAVKDSAIEAELRQNEDTITVKAKAMDRIKAKIREVTDEQKKIQDAAVKFSLFLKKHSIIYYNDAMLEYLDHLIREEACKVTWQDDEGLNMGRKCHVGLLRFRREHKAEIDAKTLAMKCGGRDEVIDQNGVDHLVESLYNLKHFGQNLEDINIKAQSADMRAYREKHYTFKRVKKEVVGNFKKLGGRVAHLPRTRAGLVGLGGSSTDPDEHGTAYDYLGPTFL